ncbi:inner membrane protein import complex subunit Tim54-domain-containing protein [Cyathus striatus]|nr:inner membrane protein import complex subunit Tim54-domain-containing protein [Cyathus striatus]
MPKYHRPHTTSWLDKRPKLPSRNWLIFLSVTSSVLGMYIYDRRQCKLIRQEYVDKVKHLAEVPVNSMYVPRKVTVLGSKWPGDEDYEQSIKYFRKYVKPILVSAAVDYEMVTGKRYGDIAKRVAEDVRVRRRLEAGLDEDSSYTKRKQQELDGGIIIVGRPTFKEFMAGLKRGWTEGFTKVDVEEALARHLEDDSHFDELNDSSDLLDSSPIRPRADTLSYSSPHVSVSNYLNTQVDELPMVIPHIPPMLLVSFTNYIGLKQIPLMMWDFFNQRHKVRSGAEAGYRIVMKNTRPFVSPQITPLLELSTQADSPDIATSEPGVSFLGDLDFDKEAESYYKKSLNSIPEEIEKTRQKYYEALPAKLEIARALARGTREPTKEELNNPPPTEVELRADRMKKELRWRSDLEGWNIVKPDATVAWDERFNGTLRVFEDPPRDKDI